MYKNMTNQIEEFIFKVNANYVYKIAEIVDLPFSSMVMQNNLIYYYPSVNLSMYCLENNTIPGFDILKFFSCSFFKKEKERLLDIIYL